MSEAQQYYYALLAQGYTPEQANGYMQQKYPGYSLTVPMATAPQTKPPQPAIPMGGIMQTPQMGMPMESPMNEMIPASGNRPSLLNWVALSLVVVSVAMLLIAMFDYSWMVAQESWIIEEELDNNPEYYFGLSEFIIDSGEGQQGIDYDGWNCNENECSDLESAGSTAMIIFWIAIVLAINALIIMCLNNFSEFETKFGTVACFASGNLVIFGTIIWLIMFPSIGELEPMYVGMSFYMAIIAGVCCVGAGVCEIISSRKKTLS